MESAEPEMYTQQIKEQMEQNSAPIKSLEDIQKLVLETEVNDPNNDKEVSQIVGQLNNDLDNNEHRKTPNRSENPEESQNMKMEVEDGIKKEIKTEFDDIEEQIPSKLVEKLDQKNFNLFEKLGECMEKESEKGDKKPEIEISAIEIVKTELKFEKMEVKTEDEEKPFSDSEAKWFSILAREISSCDGVNMTSGNRWDTNTVGVCTRESYATELKIPVFPPPNCSNSFLSCTSCDSPGPLQMSAEESVQLEQIKLHGPPPSLDRAIIPPDLRTGWWRIADSEQLREVLDNMHPRGVRERELKRTFQATMQAMYECSGNVHIEEGQKGASDMTECPEGAKALNDGVTCEDDKHGAWNPFVAVRVDLSVLEQVRNVL